MGKHPSPLCHPPPIPAVQATCLLRGEGLTWHHLVDTPQEEVGQEGEERGVEAVDCREVGQQSECHACTGHRESRPWGTVG